MGTGTKIALSIILILVLGFVAFMFMGEEMRASILLTTKEEVDNFNNNEIVISSKESAVELAEQTKEEIDEIMVQVREEADELAEIETPMKEANNETKTENDQNYDSVINSIQEQVIKVIEEAEQKETDMSKVIIRKDRSVATLASDESIEESKLLMLELINQERTARGLDKVIMGSNTAAQPHADSMLENCFLSHWGIDGMKPYMRYTLAGGYQYNAENVSGLSYCVGYGHVNQNPNEGVRDAMDGLMLSPGHRKNILDPHHEFVNIGVANDNYNTAVVQHFEYNYIEKFASLPEISNGILTFSTSIYDFSKYDEYAVVDIYYDQPPHVLTVGQVHTTYCYELINPVASIRAPLDDGWYYDDDPWMADGNGCNDPYDNSPSTPAPLTPTAALSRPSPVFQCVGCITVPYVTADSWERSGNNFSISVDIGDVLDKHGDGVYTVLIGGFIGNNYVPFAEYSIFYGIE